MAAPEVAPGSTRLELIRTRPTRRMLVVPPLGLILFAAGQNVGAGYLLVLAGGLIAASPWAWVVARRSARAVDVRREVPQRASAGHPVEVVLHVSAPGSGAIVLRDELTGTVGVVDDPRSGGELRARVSLARGSASGGEVTGEVGDPLGLVRATVTGTVPSRLEVVPEVVRIDVRSLADVAGRRAEQERRLVGDGAQTDGTREYRRGDPVRSVHWRSSARRDELVVRRLVGEATGRLRLTIVRGLWDVGALDAVALVLAAAADGATERGVDVEIAVGDDVLAWTSSNGRRLLAHVRPNLGTPKGDGSPDREAPGLVSARPASVAGEAHVGVEFAPRGATALASLVIDGTRQPLGVLPSDADAAGLTSWAEASLTGAPAAPTSVPADEALR